VTRLLAKTSEESTPTDAEVKNQSSRLQGHYFTFTHTQLHQYNTSNRAQIIGYNDLDMSIFIAIMHNT
jgi:hypothetical protein